MVLLTWHIPLVSFHARPSCILQSFTWLVLICALHVRQCFIDAILCLLSIPVTMMHILPAVRVSPLLSSILPYYMSSAHRITKPCTCVNNTSCNQLQVVPELEIQACRAKECGSRVSVTAMVVGVCAWSDQCEFIQKHLFIISF